VDKPQVVIAVYGEPKPPGKFTIGMPTRWTSPPSPVRSGCVTGRPLEPVGSVRPLEVRWTKGHGPRAWPATSIAPNTPVAATAAVSTAGGCLRLKLRLCMGTSSSLGKRLRPALSEAVRMPE
jgi:hypothetical protein